MSLKAVAAVLAAVFLSCLAARPAAADTPLSAYAAYPHLDMVAISPDGTKLAYVTFVEGKHVVLVRSLADGKLVRALDLGDAKLRDMFWGGNDHILAESSTTTEAPQIMGSRREWATTTNLTLSDGSTRVLMQDIPDAMNVTDDIRIREVNGKTYAYALALYSANAGYFTNSLFKIDLDTGHTELVDSHPDAMDWLIDADGNIVAETNYSVTDAKWTLKRKLDNGAQTAAIIDAPIDIPDLLGLSEDGSAILVRAKEGATLLAYSSATGAPVPPPFPMPGSAHFIDGVIEDPATHRIIAATNDQTNMQYAFFSPPNQALWQRVRNTFSDSTQIVLASWSDDKSKLVLHLFGPSYGDVYELLDLKANSVESIGPVRAEVGQFDTAPMTAFVYNAADGTPIPAYLTLPRGIPAKTLPLIVFPHGGPAARDKYGFDWWAQAMASRGYAVLQPQFRGSYGYGTDLLSAGFGEWGRKMQTDLSDGVRTLAAQGTIDPKRVCIVGASYGGYAALAGATLDTGIYRCAASLAGLSGLHEFVRSAKEGSHIDDDPGTRFWLRFLGAGSSDDPVLDQLSPIRYVDKVTIPILLIHGDDDTVVPIEQSEAMNDALQAAKKDVTFVKLAHEDHWLSRPETRAQMLDALMSFLAKNNPP